MQWLRKRLLWYAAFCSEKMTVANTALTERKIETDALAAGAGIRWYCQAGGAIGNLLLTVSLIPIT
jgi:hypothetical protein